MIWYIFFFNLVWKAVFFCLWVYFDIPACMPPYVRATSHTFYIKVIQYCVSKWSRKKIMHQWPGHLGLIPIELYTAIGTFRHVLGSYPTKKRFFLMTRPGGTFLRLLISYQFHVTAYNIILCKTSWKRGLRTSDEGTFFCYIWKNLFDDFKRLFFCFHTFGVRRSIDVLDPENQPGSGKFRTGVGAKGLTEDVWHQKYENK